ncbi:MAG: hypothetical protein HY921_12835 [Elusimicrobia bacterium]|nr:hypothetical protein [Elusimicrobiota bacterium]
MNTNEAAEAMKQIEEIHKVIEGSNKAIFSGGRMIAIGIIVTLIPAIEWVTQGLTFGIEALSHLGMATILIHTGFYWGLCSLAGKLLHYKKMDPSDLHPLIQKAFGVKKAFLFALIGTICSFSAIGQGQLIHPMVFILLGFLFSLYGMFSISAVSYIAWSYLFCGVVYAYLTKFNIPYLPLGFALYNGLSLIMMGFCLRKEHGAAE